MSERDVFVVNVVKVVGVVIVVMVAINVGVVMCYLKEPYQNTTNS